VIELGAVLDEETVHAGELVGLGRQHHDVEVEVGEICTGQLRNPGLSASSTSTTPDILSGTR
jgi:hypothetical protein